MVMSSSPYVSEGLFGMTSTSTFHSKKLETSPNGWLSPPAFAKTEVVMGQLPMASAGLPSEIAHRVRGYLLPPLASARPRRFRLWLRPPPSPSSSGPSRPPSPLEPLSAGLLLPQSRRWPASSLSAAANRPPPHFPLVNCG